MRILLLVLACTRSNPVDIACNDAACGTTTGGTTTGGTTGGTSTGGQTGCAAIENCFNDLDDDCDGLVDNGCPDSVSVGAPRGLATQGSTTANEFTVICPPDEVAVAGLVYEDALVAAISGVGLTCARPALQRGRTAYSLTLTQTGAAPDQHGNVGGTFPRRCDQGQVLWSSQIDYSSPAVRGLLLDCARPVLTLSPDNQLAFDFASVGQPAGYDAGVAVPVVELCGANEALVGYVYRAEFEIDQLQPICAPLVVQYH
jgi:hypothetical protein